MTAAYVLMIALGVFGLVFVVAIPAQKASASKDDLIATQQGLIDALNRKADALEREARAAENLADEREKALVLYRRIAPEHATTNGAIPQTFGIPAEKLGGGKGN